MAKFDSPIDLLKYITDNYVTFADAEVRQYYNKAISALAEDLSPMAGDYTPTEEADEVYESLEDLIERRESPIEEEEDEENVEVEDEEDDEEVEEVEEVEAELDDDLDEDTDETNL